MTGKLTGMNLGEAIQRLAQTDPMELAAVTNASMNNGEIERLVAAFEVAARADQSGVEFWSARDLQNLLEYTKWENFETAIRRAMISCHQSGQSTAAHWLPDVRKSISGKGKMEDVTDYKMTRYACYLTAQNSDARKKPVAFAQTYFTIQTRRQELANQAVAVPQSEDEKRVFLRQQIKEHNIKLSSAAKDAGVITSQEFAIFHGQGWQGMYAMNVAQIRAYKGLPAGADILDRMGSTELAANFFRVTQAEERLRNEEVKGKQKAYFIHFEVGRKVREAMLNISKTSPEDLPAVENISQAAKRLKFEAKKPNVFILASKAEEPEKETPRPIDLRKDLWKYALLVMATKPDGIISTSELITELPNYIRVPDDSHEVLTGRKDSKFSQLVRNLKSHKTVKTNFIYQGFAEEYEGGFRITQKGRDFVKNYFSG